MSFFASCDNDSNDIGTNIVGDDNFAVQGQSFSVKATPYNYGVVASNNLPTAALGTYVHPVFGKTTANYATEVVLATVNPTIDATLSPTVTEVTLSVPYFSTVLSSDATTAISTYELDSIYGNASAFLKLKVYRSRVYMSDPATPNFYTDQNTLFQNPSADDFLGGNDDFFFDKVYKEEETFDEDTNEYVKSKVSPRMILSLEPDKFKDILFSAAAQGQLLNNNVFKQYFRGLYFSIEERDPGQSVMGMLNFAAGKITVKYLEKKVAADALPTVKKTIVLNLTGNSVSLLNKTNAAVIPDEAKKLVLEGGQGKMAVIELFPNENLETLRAENMLINDATLTFHVDTPTMAGSENMSRRIYLYDLTNNTPIIDYSSDVTTNATNVKLNKSIYGGILQVVNNGTDTRYTIKLTNHVINILKDSDSSPSDNVKLGLVVTENINAVTTKTLKNAFTLPTGEKVETVPTMSVVHPFGTVLWGSGADVPEDKRLKFQIYYTKPN
ncbi:DUF4270 domain-containing protein [Flavobacterium noncentrifugens]|uniref:DUF4270 domain-containing protein n=1 Tax=Flavobacterium noncentrifugens TaxID=1128970 RepID=UPI001476D1C4|nr:DUF4270 domain-containing protein [Flavobacterium noncentrifugens]